MALTVNEGEMGTLTCRASHDPFFELEYVWLKEGIQVDPRLPNYEIPQVSHLFYILVPFRVNSFSARFLFAT